MPGFTIACPECGATLKSNKPVTPGKAITCPKCDVMFAAPKPKPQAAPKGQVEVLEQVEFIEDVEIIGDDKSKDAKEERSKGGPPRARRGKAKRQKLSTLALVLMLSGAFVGVGGLALGGWLVWKYVINAPSDLVAYVPDDAGMIAGADIGRIMSSTSLVQVIDFAVNSTPIGAYFRTTSTLPKLVFDRAIATFGEKDQPESITVMAKSAIDKEKFAQSIQAKPTTFAGRDAYQFDTGSGAAKIWFNSPKSLTIVEGDKRGEAIAQQIGKGKPAADISAMITKAAVGDIWLVIDADSSVFKSGQIKALPSPMQTNVGVFTQTIRSCGFWLRFGATDALITMHFQTRKGAGIQVEQVVQSAKAAVDGFRSQIDTIAKSPLVPAQTQAFLPMLGEISNTIVFSSSGDTIIVKAKTKSGPLEKALEDLIRGLVPAPRGR